MQHEVINNQKNTLISEDMFSIPFFSKIPLSIERGKGIYVWDEDGNRYIDFTSGWGVTCLGHSHPVIINAITEQAQRIIQNPNSGLTYSPARARLLSIMQKILPHGLTKVFFTNSGAESNDAILKLARKVSGKRTIITAYNSFHGRTLSTLYATGQPTINQIFQPSVQGYEYCEYGNIEKLKEMVHDDVAAIMLEPVQGEGGVIVPPDGYLRSVSKLCKAKGVFLIMDEIQTGFQRTGKAFASLSDEIKIDFVNMGKGIAGGFPFAGFAITDEIAAQIEIGDHGGTYCGNPLGCHVSHAVIEYMIATDIGKHVEIVGRYIMNELSTWKE